ncbi:DUF2085 domain-containing protein [Paenibacillus selenitireducens]|nr:DUF2085 domain-containing protein [Paenibacillus selenitireducens]
MKIGCSAGCHQRADRSFFFRSYQFPVCARCTGVAVGQMAMILQWIWLPTPPLLVCVICLGILFVDWFIQQRGWLESTNLRRLLTGTIGGYGLIGVYATLFQMVIHRIIG